MGGTPLVGLAVNPPQQPEGPLQMAQQAMSVQALIAQDQLRKQQMQIGQQTLAQQQIATQEAQQQQQDTQRFNQAFHDAKGDWNQTRTNAIAAGVSGAFITRADIARADQVAKMATADKDRMANETARVDQLGKDAIELKALPVEDRPTRYMQQVNGHMQTGAYPPGTFSPNVPTDTELDSFIAHSKAATDMQKDAAELRAKNEAEPGAKAESKQKELGVASQFMNGATNQLAWTARRQAAGSSISPDTLKLIPEQYSPEAAESVRQLGITPKEAVAAPAEKLEMMDWLKQNPTKVVNGQKVPNGPSDFALWKAMHSPTLLAVGGFGAPGDPMVDMVGQNRIDLPTALQRVPAGAKDAFLRQLDAKYPGYNQGLFGIEKKVGETFTSGDVGKQLMAINTAREHMKTFTRLADALDNSDIQAANKLGNFFGIQFGSDKATNLRIAQQAFGGEVGKAFDGAGVVASERAEASKAYADYLSKGQFKGAVQTVDELLAGKQRSAKAAFEAGRQGKPLFGEQAAPTPTGGYTPPAGAKTATGPNGHKINVDNGQWVDSQTGKPL